jgi:hypothetical protein
MAQQNFDFDGFKAMTERKPAGLQIYLAQQLLSNALWSMDNYDSIRADELRGIFGEVKALRAKLKDDAIAREAA